MRKLNLFIILGIVMIIGMIAYVAFALRHPEMSFPGGNKVAYPIYIICIIAIIAMFVLAKFGSKK